MTAEQRRCRLVVVGTALKYLTRDWERSVQHRADAQKAYEATGTVATGASKAAYRRAKVRWTAACEAVAYAERYVHEANEMVRELKEMEVTE
ncbi:MAG TPA: hypothetical protein PLD73_01535 [Candidatus Hydrogenedentes bacterium]|nr:hypothetical protein [Candidatus Hydrogenedentota bacterium]